MDNQKELVGSLHKIVREDPFIGALTGSIGLSLDNFDAKMNDLLAQLNIDTATWGLKIYEKELGLKTDISKPLEDRRSVIKSKIRGTGKIGALQIKIVADAYSNGNVEVSFDKAIVIKFNGFYGVPKNLDDLKNAVREIAPAHLVIRYDFKYLLIRDINNVMTFDQLKQVPFSKLAFRRTGGA
ncbi:DUF2313 domain-containing protein [Paenibacillus chibensis]|uniref:DUF2313 domain-containing protein n=1 Tax=Paenibacillus chibensis TaxID=59846 RepID=A0ABU6PST5_9BACL|nr:DUF2313 domain-containing protein [Paenibacillus chibensis]